MMEIANADSVDAVRAIGKAPKAIDDASKTMHFTVENVKGKDEGHWLVVQLKPWWGAQPVTGCWLLRRTEWGCGRSGLNTQNDHR